MVKNICFFSGRSPLPAAAYSAASHVYVEADSLEEAQVTAEAIKERLGWSGPVRPSRSKRGVVAYRENQSNADEILKMIGVEVK